jgi:Domain of Unknown Function with PDB structure (DUF3857)
VDPFQKTIALLVCIGALSFAPRLIAQQSAPAPAEKPATPDTKPELPFQIQLLETHIRFESNGDSRKEVHTIVKINNILGAHQFARLAFDYNRSFQQVEIPMIRISHANGGTSEVLPSAVTDAPNPAVEPYPAYHDVRIKSVRILGLQEGDTLEYRVITTTTNHPLAPDFWLEHTFDRSGQVLHEIYDLDLPGDRQFQIRIDPETPATPAKSGEGESVRSLYRWDFGTEAFKNSQTHDSAKPDVILTTFSSWAALSKRIGAEETGAATMLWHEIMQAAGAPQEPVPPKVIYKFVSQRITTVDLPLELSGYIRREPEEILHSRYGTSLEKARLLTYAMAQNKTSEYYWPVIYGRDASLEHQLPRPTVLAGALASIRQGDRRVFLAADVPEAPFGMVPGNIRGHEALVIDPFADASKNCFVEIPNELPFPATQKVSVDSTITAAGELNAKVKYTLRGDNELVLRTAFHQTPRDKWKDVANLLALSDGFRGQITNVTASDPLETKHPFTVEYELTQLRFVDWSKTPVRVPALLPQIAMPDLPPAPAAGQLAPSIELGTPLEVQTTMTLHLPAGTTVETPPGTSVSRDYATFTSKYSATQNTVTATRHINFLLRELPADRAIDYNAFLHAVQNDQVQRFTLAAPKQ